jgi:branched-chain amino acid transport system permease protein
VERLLNAVLVGIAEGATYGLIALGIVLVYKATRVLNFAQAEIGTLSLYVAWLLTSNHVPVLAAAAVAIIVAAALGAATERVLRPLAGAPRLTVTVATLGIGTLLGFTQIFWFGPDPHNLPDLRAGRAFSIGVTEFVWGRVLAMMITIGLGMALYYFFKRTLFGLGVLAAAQDQSALKLQGLPFNRVSAFTWASGAVLSAIAGLVLAPTIGAFTPFFLTTTLLIPGLTAALVGGLTSLPGAFIGGVIVGVIQNLAKATLGDVLPGPEFVAVFAAMVLVLLFKPNGLMGSEA